MSLQKVMQGIEHIKILNTELTEYLSVKELMTPEEKETFDAQYEAAAEEVKKRQEADGKTA